MSPHEQKVATRQRLREVLRAMSPDQRRRKSRAAADLILAAPEFAAARYVMLYIATSEEVDTAAIALRAWQEGKVVLAPKVFMADRTMLAVEISSLDSGMRPTRVGVLEPIAGLPVPPEFIDLVIVPGLGFGEQGQRLGRGGGFYDRFLSQPEFKGATCGLAFEEQVLPDLPMLPHDHPLKMLATDAKVRRFTGNTEA